MIITMRNKNKLIRADNVVQETTDQRIKEILLKFRWVINHYNQLKNLKLMKQMI